jgi:hypothetical protein
LNCCISEIWNVGETEPKFLMGYGV